MIVASGMCNCICNNFIELVLCCLQAAAQASPLPAQPRRRKASKRPRPVYELSETTAEHSSEGASDADGFFDNLCSDAEPVSAMGGRVSSTGSQDQAPASRQVSQQHKVMYCLQCTKQHKMIQKAYRCRHPGEAAEEECPMPQGEQPASAGPTQPWTFVQCDIKTCQKWRRIITADVPEGPWTCGMNHDPESAASPHITSIHCLPGFYQGNAEESSP